MPRPTLVRLPGNTAGGGGLPRYTPRPPTAADPLSRWVGPVVRASASPAVTCAAEDECEPRLARPRGKAVSGGSLRTRGPETEVAALPASCMPALSRCGARPAPVDARTTDDGVACRALGGDTTVEAFCERARGAPTSGGRRRTLNEGSADWTWVDENTTRTIATVWQFMTFNAPRNGFRSIGNVTTG